MSSLSSHYKSGYTDSQDLALDHLATPPPSPSPPPSPPPSPKLYKATSKTSRKHDKEKFKLLINMVQALAQKLKKRDGQVQHMQERVEKFIEVTLQLQNAEERLVDAAVANQSLYQRCKHLQSTIDLEGVGGTATTATCTHVSESVLPMTSEMVIPEANSQTESYEQRGQLTGITLFLQQQQEQQQYVTAPAYPVSEGSPTLMALPHNLVNLGMLPNAAEN
jgi:hypothetical protein